MYDNTRVMYNRIAFLVIVTILLTAIVSIAPINSKNANAQGGSSQNQTGMTIIAQALKPSYHKYMLV